MRGADLRHRRIPNQVTYLLEPYRQTVWAKERGRKGVERLLRGTDLVFGVVEGGGTGRLCAFARGLTDGLYRAVVFDVVVHPDFRGRGLVRMLFEAVASHPVLSQVGNVVLYCKDDIVGMYEKWGFVDQEDDSHLMFRGSQP